MKFKYGDFTDEQIDKTKEYMRKQIYFLLLCVDPKTKDEYSNINVEQAFDNLLTKMGGINDLLYNPPIMVMVIGMLNAALLEYHSDKFSFVKYRKLILDAGSEILKM